MIVMVRSIATLGVAVALLAIAAPARAQPSRCEQCHFANFFDVPAPLRLADWPESAHARHGVGCDRCHGGDPTTFVPQDAHRGILGSRRAASPVNRANLPYTCASCHAGEVASFVKSRHLAVLQQGSANAPSCSTCHGAMTARRPSPPAFEEACARCHTAESAGAVYPLAARGALDEINTIEGVLADAGVRIARVRDPMRRQQLTAQQALVHSALLGAIDAMHAFDLGALKIRIDAARAAVDRLVVDIGT